MHCDAVSKLYDFLFFLHFFQALSRLVVRKAFLSHMDYFYGVFFFFLVFVVAVLECIFIPIQ